jgi:hypothetical protein
MEKSQEKTHQKIITKNSRTIIKNQFANSNPINKKK